MRKEIILPGVAVAGGLAGFFIRRWDRAVAFEPDTGLVAPGMPSTYLLLALSAAVVVALVLLCRGKHNSFPDGYDQAFQAKGNTLYITAVVLSAFLLLGAAVLILMNLSTDFYQAQAEAAYSGVNPMLSVIPRFLLSVLCIVSCPCLLSTGKNNYRGEGNGKLRFTLLMPAYACCLWLIAAYQRRAADPVVLDYLYELFAIIAVLLGLYFTAGFSFERPKVFRASFFSLLGIYFSLVTLADGHDLATLLLYGFSILYLLTSVISLLFNAQRPERMRPHRSGESTLEDYELEEFPDVPEE